MAAIPSLRRAASVCAYATGCAIMHGLLQQHYYDACRGSWLALFGMEPGPYCALVRKSLHALQWSPLAIVGMWVAPLAPLAAAPTRAPAAIF